VPRKAQWPPLVRRHKTGQAVCRIRGKDHYLGTYSSPEAKAAYARLLTEQSTSGLPENRKPAPTAPNVVTVAAVVARWLADEAPRYPAGSREPRAYRTALAALVRLYGPLPADQFDAGCLGRLQASLASGEWLSDQERTDRPRSQRSGMVATVVNRHMVRVRTVWKWAERTGMVPRGSHAHLSSLPGLRANDARVRHSQAHRPATFDEVRAVVRQLAPVGQAMLLLQWWSGMRSGEVRTMRAGQVDTSGDVWLYRLASHKNAWRGQTRTVALGPKCKALLAPWLEGRQATDYLFPPTRSRSDCKRAERGCYSSETYARMIARAAARAGVEGFSPYSTRRAAAERITRIAGIEAARAVLGHKGVGMTAHYAGVDLRHAAEVARRLG
jgi:integrase